MAAETALFLAHGREGIVCIGDAYGGTLELLSSQLPLLGIPTHLILGGELDRLDALLAGGAELVFFETPTNPALELFDIRAIAEQVPRLDQVTRHEAGTVHQQSRGIDDDRRHHAGCHEGVFRQPGLDQERRAQAP